MFTKLFWKDVFERTISTGAETLLGLFVAGVTVATLSWPAAGVVVGTAMLVTVLKSVVAATKGNTLSPASIVKEDGV